MKNKKGFTLIELLVVVLIIGILAAIALPQYFRAVEKSKATEALSILGSLAASVQRTQMGGVQAPEFPDLDLQFFNGDGTEAAGRSFTTPNFLFSMTGEGDEIVVTAVRQNQVTEGTPKVLYTLSRGIRSGSISCEGSTDVSCASIGLKETP